MKKQLILSVKQTLSIAIKLFQIKHIYRIHVETDKKKIRFNESFGLDCLWINIIGNNFSVMLGHNHHVLGVNLYYGELKSFLQSQVSNPISL